MLAYCWALGRLNWLFIGSQLAGERAAVVMSLLQSAKLNGHEPTGRIAKATARLSIKATMPATLNPRATTAITAVQTASTMFAMGAMLGRLGVQHQDATARRLR